MWSNINEKIATGTVAAMSTMLCVYLFLVLALLPLVYPDAEQTVQYVSGAVIQLVALPLIMVGQAISNRATETRASEDHAMLMEELALLKQMHEEMRAGCSCKK